MQNVRCNNCNQLLLKVDYCLGEIKCPRCKRTVKIDVEKDRASNTTIDDSE